MISVLEAGLKAGSWAHCCPTPGSVRSKGSQHRHCPPLCGKPEAKKFILFSFFKK